jgi:arsenate reductase
MAKPCDVLILCTGNSARSLIAEALVNHWGRGRFRGHSAGSAPKGAPHPLAIKILAEAGVPTGGLASKSWNVFAGPHAPAMDIVITVCDSAAAETCPVWPGAPLRAHWGLPDPAAIEGSEAVRRAAFRAAHRALEAKIKALTAIPLEGMDRAAIRRRLDDIGAGGA